MDREIEATLLSFLADNFLPRGTQATISREDNLFDAGVLDSAGLLECVLFLEQHFDLTIPDEDLLPENFSSIASVAAYVRGRQAHARSES